MAHMFRVLGVFVFKGFRLQGLCSGFRGVSGFRVRGSEVCDVEDFRVERFGASCFADSTNRRAGAEHRLA